MNTNRLYIVARCVLAIAIDLALLTMHQLPVADQLPNLLALIA